MSTLLMVSGASRGLGRALSIAFCQSSLISQDEPMQAVLLARSSVAQTSKEMKRARPNNLNVQGHSVDLANLDTLETDVEPILDKLSLDAAMRSHAILVNCAGTTGYIGKNPASLEEIRRATDLNFTSKAWLTSRFLEAFHDRQGTTTTVVNISSMCAVKPTPTMALYCATSAAREIYHKTLALDHPSARILNYAPGSCDTDMQAFLRDHEALNPAVQKYCNELVSEGGLVNSMDTANELVRRLLEPEGFESGERVEFVNMDVYKY